MFYRRTIQFSRPTLSIRRRAHHARIRAAGRAAVVARRDVAGRCASRGEIPYPFPAARRTRRSARSVARRVAHGRRRSAQYRVGIIRGCLVTDDRERDWPLVREAERYRMRLYNRFFAESKQGFGNAERRFPRSGSLATSITASTELVAFHQDLRHHRHRHVGRAAGHPAAGHDREPRGVCNAGGAARAQRVGAEAERCSRRRRN